MVRVNARVNIGNDSRTGHIESVLSLGNLDDLGGWLVNVAFRYGCPVIVHRSCIPKSGRGRIRSLLARWVRRNLQNLIGFGVDNPRNQIEHAGQKVRQKSVNGPDQENLVNVSVQVANHRASVEQADELQAAEAKV